MCCLDIIWQEAVCPRRYRPNNCGPLPGPVVQPPQLLCLEAIPMFAGHFVLLIIICFSGHLLRAFGKLCCYFNIVVFCLEGILKIKQELRTSVSLHTFMNTTTCHPIHCRKTVSRLLRDSECITLTHKHPVPRAIQMKQICWFKIES